MEVKTDKTFNELLAELIRIAANYPYQDIVTIAAFMTREELAVHVIRYGGAI